VIAYRRFGTTYRSHHQESRNLTLLGFLDPWKWDLRVVPKRRQLITTLHCVTSQKSADLIFTSRSVKGSVPKTLRPVCINCAKGKSSRRSMVIDWNYIKLIHISEIRVVTLHFIGTRNMSRWTATDFCFKAAGIYVGEKKVKYCR
jgi:hypothetical protein